MLINHNLCTGCGACAVACPMNCIKMQCDIEGFRYPIVNYSKCITCQKCNSVCPILNKPIPTCNQISYAVKNPEENIRRISSSGGMFAALAFFVISQGGAICGAAYTDNFGVEHQIIDKFSEINVLQGAKYVQSRTEHLFPKLRDILETGRWLLFVGTPCQIAGFKSYLTKDYEKLILVDMICHGVPSYATWKKYLSYRMYKDTKESDIISINQRDKSSGWSRYRYSLNIKYKNDMTYCMPQNQDVYMLGFVNNLYLRPSCSNCEFKGLERYSDFTLGDYWGVWDQYPEFDDDMGISIVLVNTNKALIHWSNICDHIQFIPVNNLEALRQNPSAFESSPPHPKREEFFSRVENTNFEPLVSELLFGTSKNKLSLRNILQKLIKK